MGYKSGFGLKVRQNLTSLYFNNTFQSICDPERFYPLYFAMYSQIHACGNLWPKNQFPYEKSNLVAFNEGGDSDFRTIKDIKIGLGNIEIINDL